MYGCQQANVYQSYTTSFRCDSRTRFTGETKAGTSINDYYAGSLYWLLSTSSASGTLGQLYVEYEVELTIPQPNNIYEVGLQENSVFYKQPLPV